MYKHDRTGAAIYKSHINYFHRAIYVVVVMVILMSLGSI